MLTIEKKNDKRPMFSLKFSSAGKGPFTAGKAKTLRQRCTFLGWRGSGVRDMAHPCLEI